MSGMPSRTVVQTAGKGRDKPLDRYPVTLSVYRERETESERERERERERDRERKREIESEKETR